MKQTAAIIVWNECNWEQTREIQRDTEKEENHLFQSSPKCKSFIYGYIKYIWNEIRHQIIVNDGITNEAKKKSIDRMERETFACTFIRFFDRPISNIYDYQFI